MKEYLSATPFLDFEHPAVAELAKKHTHPNSSDREKAMALYYAVRDTILYDPYHLVMDPAQISASQTIQRGTGYCIEKSLALAAACRWLGIPSRLGFSIVRNHLSTEKFRRVLRSDLFVFHGYNEMWLEGKWVKCTPAFNQSLCQKFEVPPLEWDGIHDSIFHTYTTQGQQYMEYVHEYGQFADFPYTLFESELREHYPHLFQRSGLKSQKLMS